MSIIKRVTLQKIVAHDFRYDTRIILLFFTILLPTESLPLKVTVLLFVVEIFNPYLEVTVCSSHIEICSASYELCTVTWLSGNKSVLKHLFLEILIPFLSPSFHSVTI